MKIVGMLLVFAAMAMTAVANPVPEIDASSGASALALLSGGLLILRSRRRK